METAETVPHSKVVMRGSPKINVYPMCSANGCTTAAIKTNDLEFVAHIHKSILR